MPMQEFSLKPLQSVKRTEHKEKYHKNNEVKEIGEERIVITMSDLGDPFMISK